MRARAVAAALLCLALPILPAFAQPSAPQQDRRRAAETHFRQAEAYYAEGLYEQAIAAYRESYRISGVSELLINIGQSFRLKGDAASALRAYRQFLKESPRHKYADEVRQLVEVLANELGEPADSDSFEPIAEYEAPPEAKAVPVTPAPSAAVGASQNAAARGSALGTMRIAALVVGAAGLASGVVALKYGLDARSIEDELSSHDSQWTEAALGKVDEGNRAERNAIIFGSIGAGAVVAGAVMYYFGGDAKEAPVAISPVVAEGGPGLALSMPF